MRHALLFVATLVVGLGASAPADAENRYGWTISASSTDPFQNTGTATNALTTLYLWFQCSTDDGMSAAEFAIEATGPAHVGTLAMNGFLNAGGTTNLLLAVGGCPEGPVVAANLLVIDLPGTLCFAPTPGTGNRGTVDCRDPVPELWSLDWIGYDSRGTTACRGGTLCDSPLDPQAWGQVKGRYRR